MQFDHLLRFQYTHQVQFDQLEVTNDLGGDLTSAFSLRGLEMGLGFVYDKYKRTQKLKKRARSLW